MHSFTRSFLLFAVLFIGQFAGAELARSQIRYVAVEKAWFMPRLEESHEPICETIRQEMAEEFMTTADTSFSTYSIDSLQTFANLSRVDLSDLESPTEGEYILETRKLPLHLRMRTLNGCGGACEKQDLEVTEGDFAAGGAIANTNDALHWTIYSDGAGAYYAISYVEYRGSPLSWAALEAYRLVRPKDWKRSCAVRLTPTEAELGNVRGIAPVRESVQALEQEVQNLMGEEGSCGSSHTRSRWFGNVQSKGVQALYRPWALPDDDDAYGQYPEDLKNLELWSLGGLAEQEAVRRYKAQFAATLATLSEFYRSQFGLPRERADMLANDALTATASAGIRFYEYDPFHPILTRANEKELRKELMERRPLSEIRKIPLSAEEIDAASPESVLNVAVAYPEALAWLLDQGFNVNKPNAFGKTPLMYAVQINQLQSVEILLAHGADPDDATIKPGDTCNYTMRTFGMTPLHYAVRYASPAVVRALVDHQASTFLRARGENGGTPLDWLRKYTAASSAERNPAIPVEQVEAVANRLAVPSDAELAKRARELLVGGRAAYFSRMFEPAYRKLRTALTINGDNDLARNDFALVALRLSHLGESAEASERVTKSEDAHLRANAFFNLGLACEKHGRRFLEYNGDYYCKRSLIVPFLESWQAAPTQGRAEKLGELFTSGTLQSCVVGAKADASAAQRFHFETDVTSGNKPLRARIYAFHPSSQQVSPPDVSWPGSAPLRISGHYVMGANTITVFDSEEYPRDPVTIRGENCSGYR